MTDRPIIFSAPMVKALLQGRKTQTRRVLKLPTKTFSGGPIYERKDMGGWEPTTNGGGGSFTIAKDGSRIPAPETVGIWHRTTGVCMDAPSQAGDRLWVRETWADVLSEPPEAVYRADGERPWSALPWSSPMYMPRWASRLTLIISEVRVQRLQEISHDDAVAEGVGIFPHSMSAQKRYRELWDALNAKRGFGWDTNPFVVAVSFSVLKQNIDQVAP